MDSRSQNGWFYLSGALALGLCALVFFGLIAFMRYRAPIIRAVSAEEVSIFIEMPMSLEPVVSTEEPTPVEQAGSPLGVKDLFGETNTTASMEDLLRPVRKPKPPLELSRKIELPGDTGQPSRLPKTTLELEALSRVQTASATQGKTATAAVPDAKLNERYLAEVHKRLASAWHPGHADLDKMALIEMHISRTGAVEYRIKNVSGDQPFVDRLTSALEKIRSLGVQPPPKPLKLDVRFVVKE